MTKQVKRIESRENKLFKSWTKLLQSQGVNKAGLCLLAGEKLVTECLKNPDLSVNAIIKSDRHDLPAGAQNVSAFELKPSLFKELDELGTNSPIAVVQVPKVPDWSDVKPMGLEVFLALQDPGNLGAAIRSAVAFGAQKVVLLKESAHPFLPRALKSSAGTVFNVPIEWGPSIHELTPEHQLHVLDGSGQNLNDFQWPTNVRLLVGEEGRGVPSTLKMRDRTLKIEISENAESLNAGVALGIALFHRSISAIF